MIPKTIHYIWLGGAPLPELVEKCIASWQKLCPDYEIKKWDESNLNLDLYPYVRQAYDAKKYAFASDVLRYQIIWENGGIYLDVDVELIKPLDEILANELFMGFESKEYINPGLIIGAEPKNAHIEKLLAMYENENFVLANGQQNLTTICARTTEYLTKLGLKPDNGEIQKIDNITIYPTDYFCPLNYQKRKLKKTERTYAIHWYLGSWVRPSTFFGSICYKIKQIIKTIIGKENARKLKTKFEKHK